MRRASAGPPGARPGDWAQRLASRVNESRDSAKGAASMATQINVFPADRLGILPAALIVLMTILAMLGIIAAVAMA
jgi:hypothetical protein